MSIEHLCTKLRSLNKNFEVQFVNESESQWDSDEMADLAAETISPKKHQMRFCEEITREMLGFAQPKQTRITNYKEDDQ